MLDTVLQTTIDYMLNYISIKIYQKIIAPINVSCFYLFKYKHKL